MSSQNGEKERYQFIVCKVLQREAYLCAARSPHIVDVTLMPQGLHNEPDRLREELSSKIKATLDPNGNQYDAVLLGYGLCSNGTLGIEAEITTVIPRAHDCITLMLGSKERYQDYFNKYRGVYWYSAGWIEQTQQPGKQRYEESYAIYKEKYGEENAEYLMEMEQNWIKEYSRAVYIDWGLPESATYRRFTKECAEYLGWEFDEISGDQSLMQRMADGIWDDDAFLVLEPGMKIQSDVTKPGIIRAE